MGWWSDLTSGVGDFLNNITGVSSSAKQQQKAQMKLQNNAQGFNAEEAQKERDWQTEMSNTEHQRAVADMQKAGINPILAAGAGASAGSGASASITPGEASTGANGGNPLSMFLNTIATAKNIDKINTDIQNQTNKTNAEVNKLLKDAGYTQKQIEYYNKYGVFPGATVKYKGGAKAFGIGGTSETEMPIGWKGEKPTGPKPNANGNWVGTGTNGGNSARKFSWKKSKLYEWTH